MTCGNCARRATDALQSVAGVDVASVDLAAGTAWVSWKPGQPAEVGRLTEALGRAGYPGRALEDAAASGVSGENSWDASWTIGMPSAVVLGVADWGFGLGMDRRYQWAAAVVAVLVVMKLGWGFLKGAWNQLKEGGANMDTLVSTSVLAAMGYSVPALLMGVHGHLFFTEVVVLLAFVGFGHFLERRMSTRAGAALKSLMTLAPVRARRLGVAGEESECAVAELMLGDRIVLRPGNRVPVDAVVEDGRTAVDESLLTGESMPVERAPGATLFAGSLNQSGRVIARVTALGEDTALAHIADVIRRAQSTRASVQRLADRISSVFVPVVVGVAIGCAAWWWVWPESAAAVHQEVVRWSWPVHLPESPWATGVYIACAVLVIACPCAMGLATPVALMAGVNAAARRGILIRDARALETCGRVDTLLFDKTGTLTEGRPRVVSVEEFGEGIGEGMEAKALASALARRSTHPLSRAIALLGTEDCVLEEWHEEAGMGIRARWRGQPVELGSVKHVEWSGVDVGAALQAVAWAGEQGATAVLMAVGGRLVAIFVLRDAVRSDAAAVVARLRGAGLRVGLISGDQEAAARAIAQEVGIDEGEVIFGIPPQGKARHIEQLRQAGRSVAFVGDGINDGPALASADLGIAVSSAADVAREAAGIVLLGTRLELVAEALGVATATLRTIRQNLFWAFFYNAAAVPLAALGMVSPAVCAAAMGLSDLIVVGNALRLVRWGRSRG